MKNVLLTLALIFTISKGYSSEFYPPAKYIETKNITFEQKTTKMDSFFRTGDVEVTSVTVDVYEVPTGLGPQKRLSGLTITLKVKDYH